MYWMTHDDHGTTTAYDTSEKERLEKLGWKFLNEGESPNHPVKVKPMDAAKAEKAAMDAACYRLSEALGHPSLDFPDGTLPAVALIDFAVGVLAKKPQEPPTLSLAPSLHKGRDEMTVERKKPGRKPRDAGRVPETFSVANTYLTPVE